MANEFQIVDVETLLASGGGVEDDEIEEITVSRVNSGTSADNRHRGHQQVSRQDVRPSRQTRTRRPVGDSRTKNSCCHRCGKKYVRYQHLRRHLMFECGRMQGRFRCYFCPQTSKLKDNLKKHCLKLHYGEDFQYYLDGQLLTEPWTRGRAEQVVELSP